MDSAQGTEERQFSGWFVGIIQLVFVIAVIGLALALSTTLQMSGSGGPPNLADLREESSITVRVTQPEVIRFSPEVRANGTVQASAEVSVSPQVSGEIMRVSPLFRAGAQIDKGQLLFEIDRADYVLSVERAEAEIAAASSDLAQLEAEARLAVMEWEELYPGREVNELAARIPQIDAAKARLNSAVANKQTAELSLRRTRVYAPLDARVMSSTLDAGQIVSPGQTVGRLVALESIELAVPVSNDQLTIIEPAVRRPASFTLRSATSETREATVVRIDASLDARTRLSNLYLVPVSSDGLRIGDFVDVIIPSDPVDRAFVLPASALTGQTEVWVIENGLLALREITKLGERTNGLDIVTLPFDTAEGLVVVPPLEAEEGQVVSPRERTEITALSTGGSDGSR
ncbi:MAG: efflux RND transporter periplasmic adaptor subunit [Pseudomonadota bacterium]